jgi:hypothetical protein
VLPTAVIFPFEMPSAYPRAAIEFEPADLAVLNFQNAAEYRSISGATYADISVLCAAFRHYVNCRCYVETVSRQVSAPALRHSLTTLSVV